MTTSELHDLRRTVRRRAVANMILRLTAWARCCAGRLAVRPFAEDAFLLEYRDVRTLVRTRDGFAAAPRDFALVVAIPPLWPFDRAEALQAFIVRPDDFAHPNSDGRVLCLDLQGVTPERLPQVLYDNLVLRSLRLDHCMDFRSADYVRARLGDFPTDARPLRPIEVAP
jgi:hypothetical protein